MSAAFARLRGALDRVGTTTPGTIVGVFAEDLTAIMNHYVEVVREAAELKAARAQPAQAGQVLTEDQVAAMRSEHGWAKETIRTIEEAVLAKQPQAGETLVTDAMAMAFLHTVVSGELCPTPDELGQIKAGLRAALESVVLARTARVPLTSKAVKTMMDAIGYAEAPMQSRADFTNGFRHAEYHHGIVSEKEAPDAPSV